MKRVVLVSGSRMSGRHVVSIHDSQPRRYELA
jgi:hypothetical protein